jgi:RNA polymerase sigma-70 factor (ECF subfamily)
MPAEMTTEALQRLADEELMTLVERRESSAFAVLYDRHGGAAYSLALRIVGDAAAAEDVTQEAFLSLWRTRARFDATRGSVRSWLLRIVRNRAIDALRRRAGSAPALDHDDADALDAQPSAELTDVEALRRDTATQLRSVIQSLPAEQSEVIRLAYFEGFSQSEIANLLNMPLGTVKGRMRLGLEKMRVTLAEGLGIERVSEALP